MAKDRMLADLASTGMRGLSYDPHCSHPTQLCFQIKQISLFEGQ